MLLTGLVSDWMLLRAAISLCGGLRKMDFAVELLWKMRQRGINCNVHTYSCLMNVCIKNNDLDMALNVFQKLQVSSRPATIFLLTSNMIPFGIDSGLLVCSVEGSFLTPGSGVQRH